MDWGALDGIVTSRFTIMKKNDWTKNTKLSPAVVHFVSCLKLELFCILCLLVVVVVVVVVVVIAVVMVVTVKVVVLVSFVAI